MPQASDALRNEMERLFGDPISDMGPMNYLRDKGWTLNKDWTYSKPGVSRTDLSVIPQDEWLCILFLVHEWDHGGVR